MTWKLIDMVNYMIKWWYEVTLTLTTHHSDIYIYIYIYIYISYIYTDDRGIFKYNKLLFYIYIKRSLLYLKILRSSVNRFCAYNRLRYHVSVYRTIGPLVFIFFQTGSTSNRPRIDAGLMKCSCYCDLSRKIALGGYTTLNIHEIWLRLFRGEHLLYISDKMTSFVNNHD